MQENGLVPFRTDVAIGAFGITRFSDVKWAQSDLNRRPPGYQPGAPAGLSYGPIVRGCYLTGPLTRPALKRRFESLVGRIFANGPRHSCGVRFEGRGNLWVPRILATGGPDSSDDPREREDCLRQSEISDSMGHQ
jgi:hypothetical protein